MWLKRVTARADSRYDWTTQAGITQALQNELSIEGYGVAFRLYANGQALDDASAKQVVIQSIQASPFFPQYERMLQRMMFNSDNPDYYTMEATLDPAREVLMFEHADTTAPIELNGYKIVGAKATPRKQRKIDEEKQRREQKLQQKLDAIGNTDEMSYMLHANQCGYLLANTTMRFWHLPSMWATSVMTHIKGISIPDLQQFVDAAGNPTLSGISTHEGNEPGADEAQEMKPTNTGIVAMHRGFAREIVDFLNLEFVVDVDGIAAEYLQLEGDSQFKNLENWGGDAQTVLQRLIERKPQNLDDGDVQEYFEAGQKGELIK
jgi:hypothetical protein